MRKTIMKATARHQGIIETITDRGFLSVKELSRLFGVTEMTIRRDLQVLEENGKLKRHHGGCSAEPTGGAPEHPFNVRRRLQAAAKAAIGQKAASLIHDDEVVFLDGGTTTLECIRYLKQEGLTVITNGLPALQLLSRQAHLGMFAIGGDFLHDNQCFVGSEAVNYLDHVYANTALLATTCLSIERGLTNRNRQESEIKRRMVERAERVILLMDSSKFGRQTMSLVCPVEEIDMLITDTNLAAADRRALEKAGVEVIAVRPITARNPKP
jgi:DeoR/GlpR family transcriptional regulator of sugar metabolism